MKTLTVESLSLLEKKDKQAKVLLVRSDFSAFGLVPIRTCEHSYDQSDPVPLSYFYERISKPLCKLIQGCLSGRPRTDETSKE
jgi:hypothetical protein